MLVDCLAICGLPESLAKRRTLDTRENQNAHHRHEGEEEDAFKYDGVHMLGNDTAFVPRLCQLIPRFALGLAKQELNRRRSSTGAGSQLETQNVQDGWVTKVKTRAQQRRGHHTEARENGVIDHLPAEERV